MRIHQIVWIVLGAFSLFLLSLWRPISPDPALKTSQPPHNAKIEQYNRQQRFSDSLRQNLFKPSAQLEANFAGLYYAALLNREIAFYQGHQAPISQARLSPDGSQIASADQQGYLHLYSRTGGSAQIWQADQRPIHQLVFNPQGGQLLSLSAGGILRLWRLNDGMVQTLAYGQQQLLFHPNGDYFISTDIDTATLWHKEGKYLKQFATETTVQQLAFSADGKKLLTLGQDEAIRVWQISKKSNSKFSVNLQNLLKGHVGAVTHAQFDSAGDYLLSGGADQRLRLWNLHNNGQLLQLETQGAVLQVAFLADKQGLLARSDSTLQIWDLQGRVLATRTLKPGMALYPNFAQKRLLYVENSGKATYWRLPDLAAQDFMIAPEMLGSDYQAETETLLSYQADKVQLWQAQAHKFRQIQHDASGVNNMRFSPDGQWLALTTDTLGVFLQPLLVGEKAIQLPHTHPIYSVLFGQDGQLIDAGQAQDMQRWDWRNATQIQTLHNNHGAVLQLSLRADGQQFLSRSFDSVALWSITGELQARLAPEIGELIDSGYRPDGKQLYSLHNDLMLKKYTLLLWDINGKLQHRIELSAAITQACYHPNNQQLALGTETGDLLVFVWQALEKPVLHRLEAHKDAITQLHYSPDGLFLFSSALDGEYRFWDTQNDTVSLSGFSDSWIEQVVFSPDGQYVLIQDYQGLSLLWQISPLKQRLSWLTAADQIVLMPKKIYLRRGDKIEILPLLGDVEDLKAYAKTQLPKPLM